MTNAVSLSPDRVALPFSRSLPYSCAKGFRATFSLMSITNAVAFSKCEKSVRCLTTAGGDGLCTQSLCSMDTTPSSHLFSSCGGVFRCSARLLARLQELKQICHVLQCDVFLDAFGHQRHIAGADFFNLAATDCLLFAFGHAQDDCLAGFRCNQAVVDFAIVRHHSVCRESWFDLGVGIQDVVQQG